MKIVSAIINLINGGSIRSVIIKKNIFGSLIIKGFSILISFLLVPLTLKLLDSEKYGIWITLYSIVTWFNMMDIGLGNGFRNKFTEAIALREINKAKKLIGTLYGSIIIIALAFFCLYAVIHQFINWHKILNIPTTFNENISAIVLIVFGLFSIQLILKNITTILLSLQQTALSDAVILLSNLLAFILIAILGYLKMSNLKIISLVFMLSPIIIFGCSTFILFNSKLKDYRPKNFKIEKKMFSDMMNLGIKFFFIQITTIIMFSSGNFIIAQLYGPKEVTPYNISYRLFSTTLTIFMIVIAPFWSAYTDAVTKNDYHWIKNTLKKLDIIWLVFIVGLLLLIVISPLIYKIWIGNEVQIPLILSFSFALYAALLSRSNMFSQFLNGVGKIKIQLYISLFQCLSNIPLAIFFARDLNFGIAGIIMATNINLLISSIVLPLQVKKISNQTAHGIWNK